jgi:hypothetical protein
MRVAAILVCAVFGLQAQTAPALKLTGATAERGTSASVLISLVSAPGQPILGLQWELLYPSPQLGAEQSSFVAATAPKQVGKMLQCAGQPVDAGTFSYRCILAGGVAPIPNGPIAAVTFYVREGARTGPTTIRIVHAIGAPARDPSVPFEPVQANILIK